MLIFSTGVIANETDDSIKLAKMFCFSNQECVDIVALELDSSYQAGLRDGKKKNDTKKLITARRNKLSSFCKGAPSEDLCIAYRDSLLNNYIKGLSEK